MNFSQHSHEEFTCSWVTFVIAKYSNVNGYRQSANILYSLARALQANKFPARYINYYDYFSAMNADNMYIYRLTHYS